MKSCVRKAMRTRWIAIWQGQMLEHLMHQSSPCNICLRNTYPMEYPCWLLLEDILKAIYPSFKAETKTHRFTWFSTTTWRSAAQQWSGIGNPEICRCFTWPTSTSRFYLQCWSVTVLSSSPTPTKWHLNMRFGERASRSSTSWTLPQLLKVSSWCTASWWSLFPTRE